MPNAVPPVIVQIAIGLALGAVIFWFRSSRTSKRPLFGFPLAQRPGEDPIRSWIFQGKEIVSEALKKYSGPFQVMTPTGPKIILPNRYARDVGSSPVFNLPMAFGSDFMADLPGLEPHRQSVQDGEILEDTIKVKLTSVLDLLTEPVVEETAASLEDILGSDTDWHDIELHSCMHQIYTRVSSLILVGRNLCRNEEWLYVAREYYWMSLAAAFKLALLPRPLRRLGCYVIPESRAIRKMLTDAQRVLGPEVEARRAQVLANSDSSSKTRRFRVPKDSKSVAVPLDAITWLHELKIEQGRDELNFVAGLLALTGAAQTPKDVMGQLLVHLCQYPNIVPQLRQEIIEVVGELGWSKSSLYKLKLMDSFMRESQRFTPRQTTSVNRLVLDNYALSDGIVLPKGSRIKLCANFNDPEIYPSPETFDPFRFANLNKGEQQRLDGNLESSGKWQYSASTPEWILFGFGAHACPGRFFAANSIKIVLCHLIMKYDWRLCQLEGGEGQLPKLQCMDTGVKIGPEFRLRCRRRKEEIDLDLRV